MTELKKALQAKILEFEAHRDNRNYQSEIELNAVFVTLRELKYLDSITEFEQVSINKPSDDMKNTLENLIQTIERNAIDNKAIIHNVQLWAASWRNEMQTEQKLNIEDGVVQAEGSGSYKEHGHGYSAKDKLDTTNPPRQSGVGAAVGNGVAGQSVCADDEHDVRSGPNYDYCRKCYTKL